MNMDTDNIADLIAGVLSVPGDWTVEPASGGLNSRVFFLGQPGQPPATTVRLSTESKAAMVRREAEILTSPNACECAPTGVRLIEDRRLGGRVLLVHDYVAGSIAPLETASTRQLRALGSCLASVHAQERDVYTVWPELRPTHGDRASAFRDRLSAITRYATFNSRMSDELHHRIQRVYAQLASLPLPPDDDWNETTFSLLHGDTSIGNIIWNGDSVTLIDWEVVRHGDPAEELAYVLAEQPLPEDAADTLWKGYVASGGDQPAIERVRFYAPLVALDSVFWWADFHLDQGRDPSSQNEVFIHLRRAEDGLRNL